MKTSLFSTLCVLVSGLSLCTASCSSATPNYPDTDDSTIEANRAIGAPASVPNGNGDDPEPQAGSESIFADDEFGPPSTATGDAPNRLRDCLEDAKTRQGGNYGAITHLNCSDTTKRCVDGPSPNLDELLRLGQLVNLQALDLSGRCISDLTPLTRLPSLKRLQLRSNDIEDIRPLGKLEKLEALGLAENSLVDTWRAKTDEPFSQWKHLKKLDLDRTGVFNVLPLERMTALQRLSVRETPIASLRVLRGLVQLETLHIDGTSLDDLSPLSQLRQLRVLTAGGNYLQSLEPLRGLVPPQGHLTKALMPDNCIRSCDPIAGIEKDCGQQRPTAGCQPAVPPYPLQLSVPARLVEDYAPPVLDSDYWSERQLEDAFELLTGPDRGEINWNYVQGGCDARAGDSLQLLAAHGYPRAFPVQAYGNLRALVDEAIFSPGFVAFDWHVAVAVYVRPDPGAKPRIFVLDPAFARTKAVPLLTWFERLVDSAGATDRDFSCKNYRSVVVDDTSCGDRDALLVDGNGNFAVDDIARVRGTVCRSLESCSFGLTP